MKLSIHLIPIIALLCFVFLLPYLPIQDYPNWLHQGQLLYDQIFDPSNVNHYYSLHPYFPPNAVSTILIAFFRVIVPIEIAGKLFVLATMLLLYFSIFRFLMRFSTLSKIFSAVCSFYLVFNGFLFMGALNFLCGLSLCFFGIVFFTKQNISNTRILILLPIFLFACYLCHLFALIIFAMMLVSNLITTRRYLLLSKAVICGIPTAIVFIHYYITRTHIATIVVSLMTEQISLFFSRPTNFSIIVPFHRFKGVMALPDSLKSINILTIATALLFVGYTFYIILKNRKIEPLSLSLILCVVALFLMPYEIGGLNFAAERFIIPILVCSLAYCSHRVKNNYIYKAATILMFLTTIASYSYDTYNSSLFNTEVMNNHKQGYEESSEFAKKEGTNPFLHFSQYEAIRKNAAVPIFNTGLFEGRDDTTEKAKPLQ